MFNGFLSALTYEILSFVSKHGDFFELGEKTREEKLAGFKAPAVFKKYLAEVSGAHFLKDLHLVLQVVNGADMNSLSLKNSAFFKTLLEFFSDSFASKLDKLEAGFYLLPYEDRLKKAQELLGEERDAPLRGVAAALRELLVTNSYQELAQAFEELSKVVADGATILVQIPRDIPEELKKEMREELGEKHPHSFPVFQINRQLIGGFRVFINGKSMDYSWFSKVQKLSSLTY
ncbi:hypothetical protein A3J23_03240 [Candidatus Peregrinibacteria bacterium RIFCSPLOWO2_02_FULL_48_14]|nr:MAG: hypothetical protein A2974_01050 [Candidatus Peregrinibacteria bacterium RIFCSPLOWO2_01_FULL_48_20]OGJ45194.1 MAG: hypothetical protein A3J23_03240 [Candidatus Peregrinibacteria bacterium RIFCSPLOWO2_02_FULL_48_14]